MVRNRDKIYEMDRYVPSRRLIDFDAAYYNLIFSKLGTEENHDLSNLHVYNKRMKFRKSLENVVNINQRIFKTSNHQNIMKSSETLSMFEDQIWPSLPRQKPFMVNERILDLPEYRAVFHLPQAIDWGQNDIIVTLVNNKIITGSGFADKYATTETVTEYQDDSGTAVAWSGNGVDLAVGTESGKIQIWNMKRKELTAEEKCCRDKCTITSLHWHPMHHSLAWACSKGKISRLDFRGHVTTEIEFAHDGYICNLKYSPKADYLCSSGRDGYVRIWRGDSCEPYMEIEMSNPIRAVAWHPWKSSLLAIGEGLPRTKSLSIWNVNTAKMQYMEKPQRAAAINALSFNKLSGELVCGQWLKDEEDKYRCEIVVLGGTNQVVDISPQERGYVMSLLWSPDGTRLGAAGTDETFRIYKFYQTQKKLGMKRKRNHGLMAFNECHTTVR